MPKLINIDEEIPSEFFIFVNQLNPITYHNFNLIGQFNSGAFTTASLGPEYLQKYLNGSFRYLPYGSEKMDTMALSPYFLTASADPIEHSAEAYRGNNFPLYPSRLSAVYAFSDHYTCVQVSQKYDWPLSEVQRFKLLDHPLNRVAKTNMEIVSLTRLAYSVSMLQEPERFWADYWSAAGNLTVELPDPEYKLKTYESGVIWEYLIEGAVKKID